MINYTNDTYLKALSEIKEEKHLKKLDVKISHLLSKNEMSLLDVYKMSIADFEDLKIVNNINEVEKLKKELEDDKDRFMWFYYNNIGYLTIPFNINHDLGFIETIESIINDLCIAIAMTDNVKTRNSAILLSEFYHLESACKSLTSRLGLVDNYLHLQTTQKLNELSIKDLKEKCFFRKGKIRVDESVVEKLNEDFENLLYTNKFLSFIEEPKITEHIRNLIYFIGGEITEVKGETYLLRKKDSTTSFKFLYKEVQQSLHKEIISLGVSEAIQKVIYKYEKVEAWNKKVKKFEKKEMQTLTKLMLNNHKMIERVDNENNYQIKWEYLSSVENRVSRILFEEKRTVSIKDILDKYNLRAYNYGIKSLEESEIILRTNEHIHSPRDGFWKYGQDKGRKKISAEEYIRLFIKGNGGQATFNEIEIALNEKNMYFDEKTIRTYAHKSCLSAKHDKNLFTLEKMRAQYSDIELNERRQKDVGNKIIRVIIDILKDQNNNRLNKSELKKLTISNLKGKVTISDGNYFTYLKTFIKKDEYPLFKENEYIVLNVDELQNINLSQIGKRKEPEYRSGIRSYIVNYLKQKESFQETKKVLFKKFNNHLPTDIKPNIFYKIINDTSFFKQIGKGEGSSIQLKQEVLRESYNLSENRIDDINIQFFRRKDYDVKKLTEKLREEFTYGYRFADIELETGLKVFVNSLTIENEDHWSRYFLQLIYDYWFSNIDHFDKETIFFKLSMGFETFLRRFGNFNNIKGLQAIINNFPKICEIQSYKYDYRNGLIEEYNVDARKKDFSYILGSLTYYRNLFAHEADNDNLDIATKKQNGTIKNFIALYIFIAYELRNI